MDIDERYENAWSEVVKHLHQAKKAADAIPYGNEGCCVMDKIEDYIHELLQTKQWYCEQRYNE